MKPDIGGNRRLLRSTLAVSAPTFLSRILGYIRDLLQAYYMGTGKGMDAFTIAFLIPNLLRRLTAEGAMTAAFIPVFSQIKNRETRDKLWRFANAFFFDLTLIMAALTLLGVLLSPLLVRLLAGDYAEVPGKLELTVVLTRIMFPYIFLVSLAALVMAVLNSFHKFFVPAFTPVLFNLAIITGAALLAGRVDEPAYVFAGGVIVGGILQLAFQIPYVWRQGMRFTPLLSFTHPAVRKVGRLIIPGIFGAGIYQINVTISRMIASTLEQGSVSSLYYSSRIQELTLGLFSIALSIALLPTLSDLAARKNLPEMKRTLQFSLKMITFVTFPATVGLVILHRPIVQVLFQYGRFSTQSTEMTASCLFYFALAIPALSGVKVVAPAFFALKDTKTPVKVAFFITFIYIACSLWLMGPLRVAGIALALAVSSLINFICLYFLLERKIGPIPKRNTLLFALKAALFSAAMAAVIRVFFLQFPFNAAAILAKIGILLATILVGIAVYMGLNLIFSRDEVLRIRDVLSKKDRAAEGDET
ncbi:MAG: murein biosynthesis integral membrane protein MurJ [Candidatus Aminicenantaceae bacterium]